MTKKRIIITGGHHNSALLVAEELINQGFEVVWFGHKHSMLGDKNNSAEYTEVIAKKIRFINIKAGKWQPKYKFLINFIHIPIGFFQSFYYLLKEKPVLVFSFGGYLALPVSICAWILKIPVITHEQTVVSGVANKIIAKIAKKIFISFSSSAKFFPPEKTVLTGLPLRKGLFDGFKPIFNNSKKTIYITGGKQGSHIINEAIFDILPELLEKFNVIHQCGSSSLYNDFKTASDFKRDNQKFDNYLVKEYFFENEIGNIYHNADFVVSRSGAHTVYELMALKKPAILIPIPWSNNNEQELNAKMFFEAGLGIVVTEENLGKGLLLAKINDFDSCLSEFSLKNQSILPQEDALKIIIAEVVNLTKKIPGI